MGVSIQIINAKEMEQFFDKTKKNIKDLIPKALTKSALLMQNEVKASIAGQRGEPTSVDTGRFLNSVDFIANKEQAIVFTDIEYSKYLEFGTTYIKPRAHFGNSLKRNQKEIKNIFLEEVKSI